MRTYNSTWCCQTVFHKKFSNLYSHQEYLRLCIDVHPLLHLMFHTLICHLRSLFCENTANSSSHCYFYSFFLLICRSLNILDCNTLSGLYFTSILSQYVACLQFSVVAMNSASHTTSYLLRKNSTFVQIHHV